MTPAFYLVSVDRTTVYRVTATDSAAAIDALDDAAVEVDQTTTDMRAERDPDQAAS